MQWTAVRKDIVFNASCHRCGRELASNVGIVLRDDQAQEYAFGPDCAGHLVGKAAKEVPDLTIAWLAPTEQPSDPSRKGALGRRSRRAVRAASEVDLKRARAAMAISYLLLRADRLPHISGAATPALDIIYGKFRRFGYLTDWQIRHVLNIEAKCAREFPRYSAEHLRWVYACDSVLSQAIEAVEERRRRFLTDMRDQLRTRLTLTPRELDGVNKWLARVDGLRQLPSPAVSPISGRTSSQ